MIKCLADGQQKIYEKKVNPGILIPPVITQLTGIMNEQVKTAPRFNQIAEEVVRFIGDADFGGFNLERFDLPILTREIHEAGLQVDWQNRTVYDAQKIFHLHEKRDLTAAYQFYCQKELNRAHSALADSQATLEVLWAQVYRYGKGREDMEVLKDFDYHVHSEFFDEERRFRWWNGQLYMMFGKYAKKECLREIAKKDPQYLEWLLAKDFSEKVKELVAGALAGRFPVYEESPVMNNSNIVKFMND